MAVDHYENFPVASILLPRHLRRPVEVIYHFARSADDIADEGDLLPEERLFRLDAYATELEKIEAGKAPDGELFVRLSSVIREYHLPLTPFKNLLSAFVQDVSVTRYETYDALLDYCARSANPVGILMLNLYEAATDDNIRLSDAICTALQLINFWQDVGEDCEKNRIYIPLEDMRRFSVTQEDIKNRQADGNWQALMAFEVERARKLMVYGAPLADRLSGRIRLELKLVINGGLRILEKIGSANHDVFARRPVLGKADWLAILYRALF